MASADLAFGVNKGGMGWRGRVCVGGRGGGRGGGGGGCVQTDGLGEGGEGVHETASNSCIGLQLPH